ncbi:ubiquitin-associated protein 1-like [Sardina pilchardus]|uniref:ubiquitin-associated protein 1-like n=1 Tax=Sardina pilchardus TaxID=27697 RepID=UPI002E1493E1
MMCLNSMSSFEDVPFKIPMGALDEPLEEIREVTAPDINVPDRLQILQDTKYDFSVENWVLSSLQGSCGSQSGTHPSCPPHWMMSSPPEGRMSRRRSSESWDSKRRPRSLSLGAADMGYPQQHRAVKFLVESECDAGGYSEDDEGSSTEDSAHCQSCQCGDRPRSSGAKRQGSRRIEIQQNTSPRQSGQSSPRTMSRPRRSMSTGQDIQLAPQWLGSPPCQGQWTSKRRNTPAPSGRRRPLSNTPATPSPATITLSSTPIQTRPSSAGHISTSRNHKPVAQRTQRCKTSHGRPSGQDSATELFSALSQDEKELLDVITERGYSLRTAIIALQRTGLRKPEQVLSYLVACKRLRGLGYDQVQVEEALEMFHYSESKASEFLRLLTQFNEMGFKENAIKEVLLVHGNHRERALEELMMNTL